jgi:hypothetical protein
MEEELEGQHKRVGGSRTIVSFVTPLKFFVLLLGWLQWTRLPTRILKYKGKINLRRDWIFLTLIWVVWYLSWIRTPRRTKLR